METGNLGFCYPKVDHTRCVNCGLCVKICDFMINQYSFPGTYPIAAYGGRLNDSELLSESQSGGAFYALSEIILDRGGVVYGAILKNNTDACHVRAVTKECRDLMRKSKYIQSRIGDTFKLAKQDLENGRDVLFSGTPCQIEGLKRYLKRDFSNLVTVDIVCHGVPSPLVWNDYLKYIENKTGSIINNVLFRDKTFGWGSHIESFSLNNRRHLNKDIFKNLFYDHLILRESCFNCPYARIERISDLTIGDFWGWPYEEMNDKKGISLILVNSSKGETLLNNAADLLQLKEVSIDQTLQPQLKHPAERPKEVDLFRTYYSEFGFERSAKRFKAMGIKNRIRNTQKWMNEIFAKIQWHLGIKR